MQSNSDNKWYVYRHLRNDKDIPFYIGIGCTPNYKRAFCKTKRNNRWNCITKSTSFSVEIIMDSLSKEDAVKKELEFIKFYGREINGGILCNQTDGGEGVFGRQNIEVWKAKLREAALKMTEEHKKKISISKMGHKGYMNGKKLTEDQKKKISERHKGVCKTEEHKKKLSNVNFGKKLSEETKNKISNWNKTVGFTDEQKQKMSKAASYKRSEETKRKMSESRKRYFEQKKLING